MAKKLINDPSTCVPDAIAGLLLTNTNVKRLGQLNIIIRKDIESYRQSHVTLISGGGSGHEPAHAGFIGEGCLSCAVLGNVFASPSVSAILAAIRSCAGPKGVLLIVKNYTGDRLNFGIAMGQAMQEGIKCSMVIVADDCALPEGKGITGGRGVAGTVFVHKLAGAVSSKGASLEEVMKVAEWASKNVGSLGVALSTCTVPGAPLSTRLNNNLIEIGMGIHGEPGREQISMPSKDSAKLIANIMVEGIIGNSTIKPRLETLPNQKIAVLINNLGGLPMIEMLIMAGEIVDCLKSKSLVPVRLLVGSYMTSLEMAGISLSLLSIQSDSSEEVLSLLDSPTSAPAWILPSNLENYDDSVIHYDSTEGTSKVYGGQPAAPVTLEIIKSICERIIEIEPLLTQYDGICGDGDCGLVMKAGAKHVLETFFNNEDNQSFHEKILGDSSLLCDIIANSISNSMGGTSGALIELFFRSASVTLSLNQSADAWKEALVSGCKAVQFYGGASVGMRTMLDALVPAVEQLKNGLSASAISAINGMESTKYMESLAGRSNYVLKGQMDGTPDPGAVVVAEAFKVAASLYK